MTTGSLSLTRCRQLVPARSTLARTLTAPPYTTCTNSSTVSTSGPASANVPVGVAGSSAARMRTSATSPTNAGAYRCAAAEHGDRFPTLSDERGGTRAGVVRRTVDERRADHDGIAPSPRDQRLCLALRPQVVV